MIPALHLSALISLSLVSHVPQDARNATLSATALSSSASSAPPATLSCSVASASSAAVLSRHQGASSAMSSASAQSASPATLLHRVVFVTTATYSLCSSQNRTGLPADGADKYIFCICIVALLYFKIQNHNTYSASRSSSSVNDSQITQWGLSIKFYTIKYSIKKLQDQCNCPLLNQTMQYIIIYKFKDVL